MLAGEIYAPGKIRLVEVPEPQLPPDSCDEIIFQPELACLCGSDLTYFEKTYPEYTPHVGQSLHEMVGRVVATSGSRFQPGDRVLCVPVDHYGLYQRFRVDQNRAIPVDPRVPLEHAVLAQPLGTVLCAMRKVGSVLGQDVVVMGQGPIGQLFCAVLRNLGARRIIAVEPIQQRRAISPVMGATQVVDPGTDNVADAVAAATGGRMADLVVEAVGHREHVFNQCIPLARQEGTILFFGVPPEYLDRIEWKKLFWKNLRVLTSVGPDFQRDFPLAMQWIAEKRIDVSPLVTHRFPLHQIQEAFDTFAQRREGALKVFVEFPG